MTAAILLSGGRASRLGGAPKPLLEVGGSTLLERAVNAVSGCSPIIVVGDRVDSVSGVVWMREEPRFAGPAAALIWALENWPDTGWPLENPEWTYLLGCDLPAAVDAVRRLERHRPVAPDSTDGLCLADRDGRAQWLIGVYRTAALQRARERFGQERHGSSMMTLLDGLAITPVSAPEAETADIDTWEDLAKARRRLERQQG